MKNPFASDDSSTFLAFLTGMIVLVFVALSLSLFTDNNIQLPKFSGSSAKLRGVNDHLHREINALEVRLLAYERQQIQSAEHLKAAKLRMELEQQLVSANKEIVILQNLINEAEESIKLITQSKQTYRLQYRDHVRMIAVGVTYDTITNTSGKVYENVRISEVTPLGVSISHKTGATRLNFGDMPVEWRGQFMFTANEVAEATVLEQKRLQKIGREMALQRKEMQKVSAAKSRVKEIARLRSQIASLELKYASAGIEARLAQSKIASQSALAQSRAFSRSAYRRYDSSTGYYTSYSYKPRYRITAATKKSVPGSLETWEQRVIRYQRAAVRYSSKLSSLKSQLASLDPTYSELPPVQN